jgi:CMP-N-acetylneuraminic acid synthetase
MRILAVIPARKGSKRLPGKNTKQLLDKPLICYTIEKAIRAGVKYSVDERWAFDLCVSTDDDEVKKIAKTYKGVAVRDRPKELASDTASSIGVLQDVARWYESTGNFPDYVMLLQATSPLRTSDVIVGSSHWQSLVSVYQVNDMTYAKNGAIYIVRTQLLMEEGKLHGDNEYLFAMPQYRSIDIDTEEDFKRAKDILSKFQPGI